MRGRSKKKSRKAAKIIQKIDRIFFRTQSRGEYEYITIASRSIQERS
jgi:hypothetical protein